MKKTFVLLLFSLLTVLSAVHAKKQYNDNFKLSVSYFYYPHLQPPYWGIDGRITQQFGFYYQRRVYKHIHINAGFAEWNTLTYKNRDINGSPIVIGSYNGATQPHQLQWRTFYKMMDLFVTYDYVLAKRHKLSIGMGATYCWGKNTYVDTVYYNPEPPFDAIMFSKIEPAHYWGMMPVFCYDYMLFNNRAAIGIDLRCRKYFGLYSSQVDYGIHVGVNF